MNNYVHEIAVKWTKEIDNKILGEIQSKATEKGLKTEYFLNEKAIISALEKQIPKKLIYDECYCCPSCGKYHIIEKFRHCPDCGQLFDWGNE